jgi:hypothetical protein
MKDRAGNPLTLILILASGCFSPATPTEKAIANMSKYIRELEPKEMRPEQKRKREENKELKAEIQKMKQELHILREAHFDAIIREAIRKSKEGLQLTEEERERLFWEGMKQLGIEKEDNGTNIPSEIPPPR